MRICIVLTETVKSRTLTPLRQRVYNVNSNCLEFAPAADMHIADA